MTTRTTAPAGPAGPPGSTGSSSRTTSASWTREIRALHRERRAQRRRARLRRLTGSGRTGGPLLLVALLLIAGVAGLLVMFQPRRTAGSVTPLGTAQATDRRLPDTPVTLADGSDPVDPRTSGPAVFALAPIGCRCDAAAGTRPASPRTGTTCSFYLVDRTLPPLPAGLTDATAIRLVEPTGTVAARYDAEKDGSRVAGGPVLVLVGGRRPGGRGAAEADREHAGARAVERSSRRRRPPADRRGLYGGRRGDRPRAGPGLPPGADRGRDRGGGGAGRCRRAGASPARSRSPRPCWPASSRSAG